MKSQPRHILFHLLFDAGIAVHGPVHLTTDAGDAELPIRTLLEASIQLYIQQLLSSSKSLLVVVAL